MKQIPYWLDTAPPCPTVRAGTFPSRPTWS